MMRVLSQLIIRGDLLVRNSPTKFIARIKCAAVTKKKKGNEE